MRTAEPRCMGKEYLVYSPQILREDGGGFA